MSIRTMPARAICPEDARRVSIGIRESSRRTARILENKARIFRKKLLKETEKKAINLSHSAWI
jgi:hypothetical protein